MSDRIDAFAAATEMLSALRSRWVSAVEVLELYVKRIALQPAPERRRRA